MKTTANGNYARFMTSQEVIEREAAFGDGTKATVHFVKCAHVDFERWRQAEQSQKAGEVERGKQRFIAACLVNPNGTRAMTDEQSIGLTAEGVSILFPLALETSGITKRKDPGNASGEIAANTSSDISP